MKRVETWWESYRKEAIPADAPPAQVIESRRAFYAGAAAAFRGITDHPAFSGDGVEFESGGVRVSTADMEECSSIFDDIRDELDFAEREGVL